MGSLTCCGRRMEGAHQNSVGSFPLGCPSGPILLEGCNLATEQCSRPCLLNRSATALQCECRHAPAPITISSGYTLACSTPLILICPSKCSGRPTGRTMKPRSLLQYDNCHRLFVFDLVAKGTFDLQKGLDAGSDGRSCHSSTSFQR